MKRRYKLLLIIAIGALLTFLIYFSNQDSKTNIVAIGDAVAMGMTPYNVVGISYNDYLKEYYENKHNLNQYNKEFCLAHLTIEKLLTMLEKNEVSSKSHIPIKQIIDKADILTIAIGVDEFADLSLRTKDFDEAITQFIIDYKNVLATIRSFYDKPIIILGLYPAHNFNKNATLIVNQELLKVADNYQAKFIDLLPISLNKKYYLQPDSYYLNYEAHHEIFTKILAVLH